MPGASDGLGRPSGCLTGVRDGSAEAAGCGHLLSLAILRLDGVEYRFDSWPRLSHPVASAQDNGNSKLEMEERA